MTFVLDIFTIVAVSAGACFFVVGTIGLLRFPDALTRLHALTKVDNIGLGLIVPVLGRSGRQVHGMPVPHRLHRAHALFLQDALHAPNGVAVAVKQVPDAAQQVDILRTIVAPAAAALHRLDVRETALPEPQHVLRQIELVCDLMVLRDRNSSSAISGNVRWVDSSGSR